MEITDLHAHILPGVDDGPKSVDEALQLLKLLCEDGVRTVVATPHVAPGYVWPYNETLIAEKLAELRAAASSASLDIEILGGAEIYLSPDIAPLARDGQLPTLGGSRSVLVEFPRSEVPMWVFEVLRKIQKAGYKPILAHPERNAAFRADRELPLDLVRQGVTLQVTASSLAGAWGSEAASYAIRLLTSGMARIIASDTHSINRPPGFRAARLAVEKSVGQEIFERCTGETPQEMVDGVKAR